jgi:hypothetical protein
MQSRLLWLALAAVLLVCLASGVRSCGKTRAVTDATVPPATGIATPDGAANAAREAEAVKLRARARQYDDAVYAAVATLQRYLAALGGDDRAKADAFWVGKHPPANSHEADLRTLKDLRGLRIENGKPKPLDSEPVPAALEIPVELRAGVEGSQLRRYRGWYRLRRAVSDGQWEISSASVDAVQRPE